MIFCGLTKREQALCNQRDALMKDTKTTKLTQKKVLFLPLKPHFGSVTEFLEEEGNDGDVEITYPSSCFHKRNNHFGNDGYDGERHSHKLKRMKAIMAYM